MTKPKRTVTAPESTSPKAAGPGAVVWLKEYGGHRRWDLSPLKTSFTVGSSAHCDVVVDSPHVSQMHCVLDRRGRWLRAHDASSKNGTYFQGQREAQFDIEAGDTFTVGTSTLLAMSEEMSVAQPRLSYLVSFSRPALVDDLLVHAVRDKNLLLVGEPGCGQSRIAQAIHDVSTRRHIPLADLSDPGEDVAATLRLIKATARGTVHLDLALLPPRRQEMLEALFAPSYHVRVIARALELDHAARVIGLERLAKLTPVELLPLRKRKTELSMLINHIFFEQKLSLTASDVGVMNLAALERCDYLENLDELERTIGRLGIALVAGSERKAAEALHIHHSVLQRWLDRRGLMLPNGKLR
jgi:pSer/pThr/pTyr-binding forkhead associated (FHA) protein